jgi:hypothetical protein
VETERVEAEETKKEIAEHEPTKEYATKETK